MCVAVGAVPSPDVIVAEDVAPCSPSCEGRECGPDGCGGSCGACGSGASCTSTGQCYCVPDCAGRVCGPDGCGGTCGACLAPESCNGGFCALVDSLPQCSEGWCYAPPGSFVMGSPEDELCRHTDETVRTVTLKRSLWVAETEVSRAAWSKVYPLPATETNDCPACPVTGVSFWDALAYANAQSASAGLQTCYALVGCEGTVGVDFTCQAAGFYGLDCSGFRLPTEAEWEYAARAGVEDEYPGGGAVAPSCGSCSTGEANLAPYGWYCTNAKGVAHPCGEKLPNAWGLYDTHGNVYEWVWDLYGNYPHVATEVDPLGAPAGSARCVRGGSWKHSAGAARSANRQSEEPGTRDADLGFRLVRTRG